LKLWQKYQYCGAGGGGAAYTGADCTITGGGDSTMTGAGG